LVTPGVLFAVTMCAQVTAAFILREVHDIAVRIDSIR
jgi:hypothetical protein